MMRSKKLVTLLAPLLTLGACTTAQPIKEDWHATQSASVAIQAPTWHPTATVSHLEAAATISSTPTMPRRVAPLPIQTAFGVQIDGCDAPISDAINLTKKIGFTWIKQQARWGDMQSAPDAVDWSCLDRVIPAAHAAGLKMLISVTTAPAYLRHFFHNTIGPPDEFESLAYYLHALLTRYPHQIHALECWNEPNLSAEWHGYIDPVQYGMLLSLCYSAARAIDPSILVISAGLAPTAHDSSWTHIDDRWFLRRLFQYNGARYLDCMGAHANGPDGEGELPAVLARYANMGEGNKPLCFTEFGYALPKAGRAPEGFGWIMSHTATQQAQHLVAAMIAARASGRVPLAILFNLNFEDGPNSPNTAYALMHDGFTSPALSTIREYLEGLQ
jgi:hypothetical protein